MARDTQHLGLLHIFETRSEAPEEVLVQCEFRSGGAPVTFTLDPVALTRIE
jgi:hypothetical protein